MKRRRPAAWFALLALVFAQLATAVYACPLIDEAMSFSAPKTEMATPCAEMGMASPEAESALCFEHCKVGQQLVDNHSPVPPLAVAPAVLFFLPALVLDLSAPTSRIEPLLVRATAPPVLASSSRLRI